MSQKRIEEMRQEYENLLVPEQALERVKAGIAQAKREEKGMKYYKFGKIAAITATAAVAAVVLLVNSNETIARAMEQIPIIGALTKVVTFRHYSDYSGGFEADVDIPQITDINHEENESLLGINKTIEEYAGQLIAMYEKDLKASNGEGHYKLESSYQVIRDDEEYLSIRINSLLIMAGGNEFVKIFNIDKNTGKILNLEDLYKNKEDYITIISDNIKEQMKQQMEENKDITYFLYTEEEPYGFQAVTPENNFYLNEKDELVIVFDEYEVAPGFMGVIEFTVPKEVISIK